MIVVKDTVTTAAATAARARPHRNNPTLYPRPLASPSVPCPWVDSESGSDSASDLHQIACRLLQSHCHLPGRPGPDPARRPCLAGGWPWFRVHLPCGPPRAGPGLVAEASREVRSEDGPITAEDEVGAQPTSERS